MNIQWLQVHMKILLHTLMIESVIRLNNDISRDCVVNTTLSFVFKMFTMFVFCFYKVYIIIIVCPQN